DLDFAGALARVPISVSLAPYRDETAESSTWHVPAAHEYEAWGDARAFDGTLTIQQPQVRRFYSGHSVHEVLALLQGDTAPDDYALLRAYWQQRAQQDGRGDFEQFWHDSLKAGIVENSASTTVAITPKTDLAAALRTAKPPADGIDLLFRSDEGAWDGRLADNAWLLEMPRPFTRLTWDNAALMAPATAQRLGVKNED